jgi:hypothetical protein
MCIAAPCNGQIVAAMFAFRSHDTRNPPHRRVIKQQAFHRRLQPVDEIVVAADVRQLMQ